MEGEGEEGKRWRERAGGGAREEKGENDFAMKWRQRRSAASQIDCFAELLTGVIVRASSVLVCTKYIFFSLFSFFIAARVKL